MSALRSRSRSTDGYVGNLSPSTLIDDTNLRKSPFGTTSPVKSSPPRPIYGQNTEHDALSPPAVPEEVPRPAPTAVPVLAVPAGEPLYRAGSLEQYFHLVEQDLLETSRDNGWLEHQLRQVFDQTRLLRHELSSLTDSSSPPPEYHPHSNPAPQQPAHPPPPRARSPAASPSPPS
eukprot:RCo021502